MGRDNHWPSAYPHRLHACLGRFRQPWSQIAVADFRAGPMVIAVVSSVIPLIVAIVSCSWYLSGRLSKQDGWMHRMNMRMGFIEKHLGLNVWDDDE
jgi:hypothetical protein